MSLTSSIDPLGLATESCSGCSGGLLPQSIEDTTQLLGWCGVVCLTVLIMCMFWIKLHRRCMQGNRTISFSFFLLLEVSIVILGICAVTFTSRSDSDRLLLGTIMVCVPFVTMSGLLMTAHDAFRFDHTLLLASGLGILGPLTIFYPLRNSCDPTAGCPWKSSYTFLAFGVPLLTVLWMTFLIALEFVYDHHDGVIAARGLGSTDRATLALIFTIVAEYPFAIMVPIALLFHPVLPNEARWTMVVLSSLVPLSYVLYRCWRASGLILESLWHAWQIIKGNPLALDFFDLGVSWNSVTSALGILGMILLVVAMHGIALSEGSFWVLLSIALSVIPFMGFGHWVGLYQIPGEDSEVWDNAVITWCIGAYNRYTMTFWFGVVLPATMAALYHANVFTDHHDPGMLKMMLTAGIGLPFAGLSWFVIWAAKSYMGEDKDILANSTAFCCCTIFFPIGVIVPILTTPQNYTLSDKVSGALQTVAFSLMLFVTIFTVALNIKLERNLYERTAKVAIHKLRQALREKKKIVMDPLVGRSTYDVFTQRLRSDASHFREWLLDESMEPREERVRIGLYKIGAVGHQVLSVTNLKISLENDRAELDSQQLKIREEQDAKQAAYEKEKEKQRQLQLEAQMEAAERRKAEEERKKREAEEKKRQEEEDAKRREEEARLREVARLAELRRLEEEEEARAKAEVLRFAAAEREAKIADMSVWEALCARLCNTYPNEESQDGIGLEEMLEEEEEAEWRDFDYKNALLKGRSLEQVSKRNSTVQDLRLIFNAYSTNGRMAPEQWNQFLKDSQLEEPLRVAKFMVTHRHSQARESQAQNETPNDQTVTATDAERVAQAAKGELGGAEKGAIGDAGPQTFLEFCATLSKYAAFLYSPAAMAVTLKNQTAAEEAALGRVVELQEELDNGKQLRVSVAGEVSLVGPNTTSNDPQCELEVTNPAAFDFLDEDVMAKELTEVAKAADLSNFIKDIPFAAMPRQTTKQEEAEVAEKAQAMDPWTGDEDDDVIQMIGESMDEAADYFIKLRQANLAPGLVEARRKKKGPKQNKAMQRHLDNMGGEDSDEPLRRDSRVTSLIRMHSDLIKERTLSGDSSGTGSGAGLDTSMGHLSSLSTEPYVGTGSGNGSQNGLGAAGIAGWRKKREDIEARRKAQRAATEGVGRTPSRKAMSALDRFGARSRAKREMRERLEREAREKNAVDIAAQAEAERQEREEIERSAKELAIEEALAEAEGQYKSSRAQRRWGLARKEIIGERSNPAPVA